MNPVEQGLGTCSSRAAVLGGMWVHTPVTRGVSEATVGGFGRFSSSDPESGLGFPRRWVLDEFLGFAVMLCFCVKISEKRRGAEMIIGRS